MANTNNKSIKAMKIAVSIKSHPQPGEYTTFFATKRAVKFLKNRVPHLVVIHLGEIDLTLSSVRPYGSYSLLKAVRERGFVPSEDEERVALTLRSSMTEA